LPQAEVLATFMTDFMQAARGKPVGQVRT